MAGVVGGGGGRRCLLRLLSSMPLISFFVYAFSSLITGMSVVGKKASETTKHMIIMTGKTISEAQKEEKEAKRTSILPHLNILKAL